MTRIERKPLYGSSIWARLSLWISRFLLMTLFPVPAHAANCPNLNAHPGIITIFVQSDFGDKDQASKAYVASVQDAIKKSNTFCPVEDPRAATYALNIAGIDTDEDHERAALSVVLLSEKGTLVTHFVRLSSVENVAKNGQDDLTKIERAIQRAKRPR
jgi:hypothetical protein